MHDFALIFCYLNDLSHKISRSFRLKAMNYVVLENILYKRYKTSVLLKYFGIKKILIINEVHKRPCKGHQCGIKMRWLIMNYNFHWLDITKD